MEAGRDSEGQRQPRFGIDPQSVAEARADLCEIVRGIPIAEAAVEGFNDWQVIEAWERLEAAEPMMAQDGSAAQPEDWLALLLGA